MQVDILIDRYARGYREFVGYNLEGADLRGYNLSSADLTNSNLKGAKLEGTNLANAILDNACLDDTCLDPRNKLPSLSDEEIIAAGLKVEGNLVYGWRTEFSQYVGTTHYKPGRCYIAPVFSTDIGSSCHPGIYLSSLESLLHSGFTNVINCFCRKDELLHAVDKWRCKRLWISRDQVRINEDPSAFYPLEFYRHG